MKKNYDNVIIIDKFALNQNMDCNYGLSNKNNIKQQRILRNVYC